MIVNTCQHSEDDDGRLMMSNGGKTRCRRFLFKINMKIPLVLKLIFPPPQAPLSFLCTNDTMHTPTMMTDTDTNDTVLKQTDGPGLGNTRKRRLSKRERKNLKKKKVQVDATTSTGTSTDSVADDGANNNNGKLRYLFVR